VSLYLPLLLLIQLPFLFSLDRLLLLRFPLLLRNPHNLLPLRICLDLFLLSSFLRSGWIGGRVRLRLSSDGRGRILLLSLSLPCIRRNGLLTLWLRVRCISSLRRCRSRCWIYLLLPLLLLFCFLALCFFCLLRFFGSLLVFLFLLFLLFFLLLLFGVEFRIDLLGYGDPFEFFFVEMMSVELVMSW
jgi:hypothetical protein